MHATTLQHKTLQQSRASRRRPVQVSAYLTASAPPPTIQARTILHESTSFRAAVGPKGGVEHMHLAAATAARCGKLAAP